MDQRYCKCKPCKQIGWHIMLNGVWQNTVYYSADCDKDYVRDSLISHDGYSDNIEVIQRP